MCGLKLVAQGCIEIANHVARIDMCGHELNICDMIQPIVGLGHLLCQLRHEYIWHGTWLLSNILLPSC
jgi:hypothetical protein